MEPIIATEGAPSFLANAVNVTVENTSIDNTKWGSIGMMYADKASYANPVRLIYGAGNTISTITSERTTSDTDSILFEDTFDGTVV